jgi:hypothetical protein
LKNFVEGTKEAITINPLKAKQARLVLEEKSGVGIFPYLALY